MPQPKSLHATTEDPHATKKIEDPVLQLRPSKAKGECFFYKKCKHVTSTLKISATGTQRRGEWSSFKRSEKAYQKK